MKTIKTKKRAAINSSAIHVFDVLRTVSEDAQPAGVSDISRRLSLTASTVFRALTTLESSGYVNRFRNLPQFELGTMPYLLNRALLNRFELNAASRPFLRELAQETGETVSLNARLGWYTVRLSGIYGSRDIYHRDRLGELALLHKSVAGRAILAFLPDEALEELPSFLMKSYGEQLKPEAWHEINKKLQQARRAGLVSEGLPASSGFSAIALPVRDEAGIAIASIAINGLVHPSDRAVALIRIRDRLEQVISSDPKRFVSPFAHIQPSKIYLKLPSSHQ